MHYSETLYIIHYISCKLYIYGSSHLQLFRGHHASEADDVRRMLRDGVLEEFFKQTNIEFHYFIKQILDLWCRFNLSIYQIDINHSY